MQRTVGRDNPFEKEIRSCLNKEGLRFRIHYPLPGLKRTSCDIAFPGLTTAIFLDGCFWHSCPDHPPAVKKNADFWLAKLKRNRERDERTTRALTDSGWLVLRFWQHENTDSIVQAIMSAVSARRSSLLSRSKSLDNV
ncbi:MULTISPECIES: very short patch repair endonuclease [unclassified Rhizobium]|uniref:very short patch repair endonuclease n=1 Tax=unclassified Rhizobium TaxID=2613769 RepID=UPI001ADCF505|nr:MULTISPECIES: very short patch repair endonuclease [unclassified Rhizobium]MBO9127948.1 very short patch repair endonuclease [Rhizobium sp. 16-488-2b]MBO9178525.1 very short patch repair endonuclease [Rhizobium sp. 16-488-2a]